MHNIFKIVLGSSRSQGNTRKAISDIFDGFASYDLKDLANYSISPFDYEWKNKNDDFLPLFSELMEDDLIILASPIYWYSPSAQMKIFLDRITDLIHFQKDLGRKLREKKLLVISSFGTDKSVVFEEIFKQSAEYLGMEYVGCYNIYSRSDPELKAQNKDEIHRCRELLSSFL